MKDFDYELEVEIDPLSGITLERVLRARENMRALEGLREQLLTANRQIAERQEE